VTAARARRVDRLEEAAARRAANEAAIEFALTPEEAARVVRDTRRALLRRRAGLPVDLDWLLDEAAAECGLSPDEREALGAELRARLVEGGDGRRQ
jgi:hypothetical protein